jgi:hypothetical protein
MRKLFSFELNRVRQFTSGLVLLHYRPGADPHRSLAEERSR